MYTLIITAALVCIVSGFGCPPGVPSVRCRADPCRKKTCPGVPNAECRPNFCGGCFANFFLDGTLVNRDCKRRPPAPGTIPRPGLLCPPLVPIVQCAKDPCDVTSCPGVPQARCESNLCGGCNANFFINGNVLVNDRCNVRPAEPACISNIRCFFDPCKMFECPAFRQAECRGNFCFGCNANFYLKGENVTEQCGVRPIAAPQPPVACLCAFNPCDPVTCPLVPEAECRPNLCGGCTAEFYVGDRLVNKECGPLGTEPPLACLCAFNPCDQETCPFVPEAECRPNLCGGCTAEFYVGDTLVNKACGPLGTAPPSVAPPRPTECPPDVPVALCADDPCKIYSCPGVPQAECRPNFCGGCKAFFYKNEVNVTASCQIQQLVPSSPTECPPGVPIAGCAEDPCTRYSCPGVPGAQCIPNFCGSCKAFFYKNDVNVTASCQIQSNVQQLVPSSPTECPPGVPIAGCAEDPCTRYSCPGVPGAQCIPNFCGGCKAFFFKNGVNVTASCQARPSITQWMLVSRCPPGVTMTSCLVNPCAVETCPGVPDAQCRSNFCGGCFAHFFKQGRNVTDSCTVSPPAPPVQPPNPGVPGDSCPPGVPIVLCFANPCDVTTCPGVPDATCMANFCGGCNAYFFKQGVNVTEWCDEVPPVTAAPPPGGDGIALNCPPSVPIVPCYENPCDSASCPGAPDAVCRPNSCGACRAVFLENGVSVNDKCMY